MRNIFQSVKGAQIGMRACLRHGTLDNRRQLAVGYEVKWLNGSPFFYRMARHKYIVFIVIT
jgi:hypothetical protein